MEEYTMEELRERLYPCRECNLCKHYEGDIPCKRGRRPRRYRMLDGPNEECLAHFSCFEWEQFDASEWGKDLSPLFTCDTGF